MNMQSAQDITTGFAKTKQLRTFRKNGVQSNKVDQQNL